MPHSCLAARAQPGCRPSAVPLIGRLLFVASLVLQWGTAPSVAELITHPQQAPTHLLNVRLIQTAKSNGGSPATVLGNASQRADILNKVDLILGQVGVEVRFEPEVVRLNDDFVYQGSGLGRGALFPNSELTQMFAVANEAGVLSSDPETLNVLFTKVVPGQLLPDLNRYQGYSFEPGNGISVFVGSQYLSFPVYREAIATFLAHEIGHNFGLSHVSSTSLLMRPDLSVDALNQVFAYLTASDKERVLRDSPGLLKPITIATGGDYNGDGAIDAADYTVWRDAEGGRLDLTADGNLNRVVGAGDYRLWRDAYGKQVDAAGGSVPEPGACVLLLVAAGALATPRQTATRQTATGASLRRRPCVFRR